MINSTLRNRRQILKSGLAFTGITLAGAGGAFAQTPSEGKTPWREVFDLKIKDPELLKHVEGFFNVFEKGVYPYALPDGNGGLKEVQITGQQILGGISKHLLDYRSAGLAEVFEQRGWMSNGRFMIKSFEGTFDGSVQTGSNTAFVGDPNATQRYPVFIQLGTEYLKGAKFYDSEGALHPVTVDGVLANEIAHLWQLSDDETMSNDIERIITSNMGGALRDLNRVDIEYTANSNGGYQTLYDKVALIAPSVKPERAPKP